jgi:hypothetical protein
MLAVIMQNQTQTDSLYLGFNVVKNFFKKNVIFFCFVCN